MWWQLSWQSLVNSTFLEESWFKKYGHSQPSSLNHCDKFKGTATAVSGPVNMSMPGCHVSTPFTAAYTQPLLCYLPCILFWLESTKLQPCVWIPVKEKTSTMRLKPHFLLWSPHQQYCNFLECCPALCWQFIRKIYHFQPMHQTPICPTVDIQYYSLLQINTKNMYMTNDNSVTVCVTITHIK